MRIVNASPLTCWPAADCLELLREPPDSEVTVPNVAFHEVLAGESFDPNVAAVRLAAAMWLRVARRAADRSRTRPRPT